MENHVASAQAKQAEPRSSTTFRRRRLVANIRAAEDWLHSHPDASVVADELREMEDELAGLRTR